MYKCNSRGEEYRAKGGIKTLTESARRSDTIIWPYFRYCLATFNNLATLNRNIRNRICKYREENWKTVWEEIYTAKIERVWGELSETLYK